MAQVYNQFRVLNYSIKEGSLEVIWYDKDSATPPKQQRTLRRSHKIPNEAIDNNWDRATLTNFFADQVEDVMDVPQWAIDEANNTKVVTEEKFITSD